MSSLFADDPRPVDMAGPGAARIPRQRPAAEPAGPMSLTGVETSEPTRYLCTLVHVEQELRDVVDEHFPAWRARAWAPCYGIDLVALLRHNRSAARLAHLRDAVLTGLLLTAATAAVLWTGSLALALSVAVCLVVAVSVLRWDLRRRKISARQALRTLFRYARRQGDQFLQRVLVGALALAALAVVVAYHRTAQVVVGVITAAAVAAWLANTTVQVIAYLRARRVLTATGELARLGARIPATLEKRAEAISDATVLVYDRERARSALGPFVGAGHLLTRWNSDPVDVTVPMEGSIVRPVDVLALHRRLVAAVAELGLPNVVCRHRVYVDGRSEQYLPDLRRDGGDEPPATVLPDHQIMTRVARPAKYQRGYLCLQAEEPDGEVIVTVFVRAIREGERLQLEVSVNALPEVTWPRQEKPETPLLIHPQEEKKPRTVHVPPHLFHAVWHGLVTGTRSTPSVLFAAPSRTALAILRPGLRKVTAWRDRRGMERGDFDFGANASLREDLAMNKKLQHHNAFIDMLTQADRLQRRVVDAVAAYLEEAGIDASEFRRQSAATIVNMQQYIISTINSQGGVTFGSNNTINNNNAVPPQQQTQGPGGQQPPQQQ
ncbi:hypothetical protein Cs7R123_11170 [Catellatospora sp. TT07R-123]|uniref:hypothetical protein n=1 Tax=Catellatospora sp. TT07R-123 TaxID=2733863 RepID=UPI001B013A82|nr:hypothetical protein [Catellatospora sp. TT07R-123]GHJ43775.1 hypothetical protein Cs7R123_11170 [Catellatospora sp. TT07R-123]